MASATASDSMIFGALARPWQSAAGRRADPGPVWAPVPRWLEAVATAFDSGRSADGDHTQTCCGGRKRALPLVAGTGFEPV
jgi:hypothetical protein